MRPSLSRTTPAPKPFGLYIYIFLTVFELKNIFNFISQRLVLIRRMNLSYLLDLSPKVPVHFKPAYFFVKYRITNEVSSNLHTTLHKYVKRHGHIQDSSNIVLK